MSLKPRAFYIPDFLSAFEADNIIAVARPKINVSLVGNYDAGGARSSSTRTSRNAWIGRGTNEVIDTLYRRTADFLNIDEALLVPTKNVEELQVVNYQHNQRYDSHHDWGVSG